MASPLLTLVGASLTLTGNAGPVEILHGINLDVHRGETVGLVGPSGSGKSSLLMLMGGLERATSGRWSRSAMTFRRWARMPSRASDGNMWAWFSSPST